MPNIAIFVHRYPPALGGSESYAKRLAEFHAAHGDRVTVFTTTALELGEFQRRSPKRFFADDPNSNPKVRRFRPVTFPLRRYWLKAASQIPVRSWQAATQPSSPVCPDMAVAALRFEEPLDAVHAIAFPYSFPILCALRLARRRRVPFYITPFLHWGDSADPSDRTRRQYTRPHLLWLLKQAAGVFVQTPGERRAVVDLGVPAEHVILQGLGVDAAECTGGNLIRTRATWRVPDVEFVIGHLANASIEKGTVDLLKATAGRFRVVLAGPAMPNFEQFWATYPHKNTVTRLGPIDDSTKRDFFAAIDLFALPSRSDSFGLVLLEAWANSKPVLAYRAGGPGELIRDGIDGAVVECGNISALAERVAGLAADAPLRVRWGEAGAARVAMEFDWRPKLELVRKTIIGERDRSRRSDQSN